MKEQTNMDENLDETVALFLLCTKEKKLGKNDLVIILFQNVWFYNKIIN